METEKLLAGRTRDMHASALREILKAAAAPGVVSLAGGLPAAESFPLDVIRELTGKVFDRYGHRVLQYDRTEGFAPLCGSLAKLLGSRGITAGPEDVLVTSGSQGTLDALGKVLISAGDAIAVESPSYLGALQAFRPYGPRFISIATDEEGIIPAQLEEILRREPVKFIYLVPTFQNPTGRTLSRARRQAVAELLQRYDTLLVEDDPYSALRYRGEALPPIKSLAPEHVIYCSTLSKVFAAGLRIGFTAAPPQVARWLVLAKQGTDLHTSTFNQALAAEYIDGGYLGRQVPQIISLYRPRLRALAGAIRTYLPAGFSFREPDGGMFLWLTGPDGMDAGELAARCLKDGVAVVPGTHFFAKPGAEKNTMRLNFTNTAPDDLEKAVLIIAENVKKL